MPNDAADHHVERWRDHWVDVDFDEPVELFSTRLRQISAYLDTHNREAIARGELSLPDYETLHRLMISDTPGRATPTELARRSRLTGPGMTTRIDGLVKRGYVKRIPDPHDRRRVDIEATAAGVAAWRATMALRGRVETDLAEALTDRDLATLNRLLKKLTLHIEGTSTPPRGGG